MKEMERSKALALTISTALIGSIGCMEEQALEDELEEVYATDTSTRIPEPEARACHFGSGDSIYGEVKEQYPYRSLHGPSLNLRTGTNTAAVYAIADLRAGDILSIDRANFKARSSEPDYFFLTTEEVHKRGTWDYCEWTVPVNGRFSTDLRPIDGAHRPVRVCLRRNGFLDCAPSWYVDNDDP